MKLYFDQLFGPLLGRWRQLSPIIKISIGVISLGLVIGLVTLVVSVDHDPYEYLFVDLSNEDQAAIVSYLKSNGFEDFVVDNRGIKVKPVNVPKLRIQLSQEGLPTKGVVGWEKFDERDFTRTEFEQQIQKQRAVQGELARTISAIDGVLSARVHIVQPKNSLFVRDEKAPTAAIYIKTKRGADLDQKKIKGIQHLVSRSVEGLELNNVTIIDAEGRMLTEVESTDYAAKITKEMMAYKQKIENTLEERIRAIVGRVVGPDRVEAKVDAEVDFTQEKQLISDVDPDNSAVIAKNTTGFSMEGQGLNPTGIPGSKSNVPGEQEDLAVNQSKAGSKRESEIINYEISKVTSERTLPVGNIKRLSISVLVDGKQQYATDGSTPDFQSRGDEEMKKIEDLVKSAVGYKEDRDSITVHNMMFQLDPFQMLEITKKKEEDREYFSTLAISSAVALALILFFAFIVRPYFRWLSYDPERKKNQNIVEEYKPDLDLSAAQTIKIQEDVPFDKLSPQEQVMFLAKHEPKRTTEAIRLLLNPHGYS